MKAIPTLLFSIKNNRLFKIAFSHPRETHEPKRLYYPNDDLIISNAEPEMQCNFLTKPTDTFKLALSSKSQINVKQILTDSKNLSFLNNNYEKLILPFSIEPGQAIVVHIVYHPTPENLKCEESFEFITGRQATDKYKVNISTFAAHLTYTTVESLSSISLSKEKDKYLVIPRLGTVTTAIIKDANGRDKWFDINELTKINPDLNAPAKIDLEQFEIGKYDLTISACNAGGNMTLIIRK